MTCQNCNRHEAELTISFQYVDNSWEVHLCSQCAAAIQEFTAAALNEYHKKLVAVGGQADTSPMHLLPDFLQAGELIAPSAPKIPIIAEDAGEEIRLRRRKNELQIQLQDAIGTEDYETAARLRDAVKALEKGV